MFGEPMSRANCSHSSMARSGSASRLSRGVSSCSAAVRMLSFMGWGAKAVVLMPPSLADPETVYIRAAHRQCPARASGKKISVESDLVIGGLEPDQQPGALLQHRALDHGRLLQHERNGLALIQI